MTLNHNEVPAYERLKYRLCRERYTWLITGVAGFIGSNLLEALLKLNQNVVGLDNFSTGHRHNLDEVKASVSPMQWKSFHFMEGDIRDHNTCKNAVLGVDYVLHQAALGSVPRSLYDPIATNEVNVSGFLNVLVNAKDAGVTSFVYAASSSTYGDHPMLPKVEDCIGRPLSPYAVTKYVNELYAEVFSRSYDFHSIGLRYFNVFGRRQDPNGSYAAVIPKWAAAVLNNQAIIINGDGETTRDFCYIDNVVQANLLAALASVDNKNEVYNIAVGEATSLNDLARLIIGNFHELGVCYNKPLEYTNFRLGDVRHSLANIEKANKRIGYSPEFTIKIGLRSAAEWYLRKFKGENS